MPDDQFLPGSPQDPANAHSADQIPPAGEPEVTFEPIGASAPGQWPVTPDDTAIDLPSGGQYPDDMFGAATGDEAAVSFPGDAIAGGLADVEYAQPGEAMAPLPPPPEPQVLADISIDPPATESDALVVPIDEAGGDMFSVDDIMDESAPAAAGGDMFSVDDLMDEPAADAPAQEPVPLQAPEPLAIPDAAVFEQPPAQEPAYDFMATPEPLAAAEPPEMEPPEMEPLAMEPPTAEPPTAEPPAMEPMDVAEPLSVEPLGAEPSEPDFAFEQPAQQPVAFEPAAAEEQTLSAPHGITDNQAEMPATDFGFADPLAEATQSQGGFEDGMFDPVVEPYGGDQAAPEPAPAFAPIPADTPEPLAAPVVEPLPAEPLTSEPVTSEPLTSEPLTSGPVADQLAAEPQFADVVSPELAQPEPPAIVNPYAQEPDEAAVIDPAMSASAAFDEAPEPAQATDAPAIVNPYAQAAEEAAVIDPAMSFSNSATDVAAPEPLASSAATDAGADPFAQTPADDMFTAAPGYEQTAPAEAYPNEPMVDQSMPPAYGSAMYGDGYATPLPSTDRTVSVAPPGMEAMASTELVVAGSKKAGVKSARGRQKNPATGKAGKGKFGRAKQTSPEVAMEAAAEAAEAVAPAQAVPMPAPGMPAAGYEYLPAPDGQFLPPPAPDPYAAPAAFDQPVADPGTLAPQSAAFTEYPPPAQAIPAAEDVAAMHAAAQLASAAAQASDEPVSGKAKRGLKRKSSKQPKAKADKPQKAAKQGKSFADTLLGTVEPGERHKLFGIPIGKPAPMPGEVSNEDAVTPVAGQAYTEPVAPPPPVEPAQQAFAPESYSAPTPAGYGDPSASTGFPPPPAAAPTPAGWGGVPAAPPAIEESGAGAEVIESVEATAHARGKGKRGLSKKSSKQPKAKVKKAPKAAKQKKAAKPGKSVSDALLGPVEPGERHKLFGIPIGKPAPMPGEDLNEGAEIPVTGQVSTEPAAPPLPVEPSQQAFTPDSYSPTPDAAAPSPQQPAAWPAPQQTVPPSGAEPSPQPVAPPPAPSDDHAATYAPAAAAPAFPEPPPLPPAAEPPAVPADAMVAQVPVPSALPQVPQQDQPEPSGYPAPSVDQFPAPPVDRYPQFPAPSTDQFPAAPTFETPATPAYSPAAEAAEAAGAGVVTMQSAPSYLGGAAHAQTAFPGGYSTDFPAAATAGSAALAAQPMPDAAADPGLDPNADPSAVVELTPGAAPVYRLASWRQRVFAQLLDSVIVVGLAYLLMKVLGVNDADPEQVLTVAGVKATQVGVAIIALTIYQAGLVAYNRGQTIGKKLMKLRVVRTDGKRMDLVFGMARETLLKGVLVSITLGIFGIVDAIWPLIDKQSRALHDIVVKSRVIDVSK